MTGLRDKYLDSMAGHDKEENQYFFELTGLFTRTICLMRQCAESSRVWAAK